MYHKNDVPVGENIKYQHNETDWTSVTGSASAVPSQFVDSLSSDIGKKHLVISLPDTNASKCAQSKPYKDTSVRFSVKEKASVCNGLMSLLSADSDSTVLSANSDKILLHKDPAQTEQPPEIKHRRYSCGDQFAATWWRLLDQAASFSDLRGLPRSLSRFCSSTWRTFTGVKSPCIDVSNVGNVGLVKPPETAKLNTNEVNASVGHAGMEQYVSSWWHKSVSPDKRRLIEVGSDVEVGSLCGDSPRKVDCNRVSLGNLQNLCETVCVDGLSDSDGGGSYVSLRVGCNSSTCRKVPRCTCCSKNVPHHCHTHTDCDILDENDTLTSVTKVSTNQASDRQECAEKQTGDVQEPSPVASYLNCGPSVHVPRLSPSSACSCAAVQPAHSVPAIVPRQSCTHSGNCSQTQSDQLLQSSNGYINLSLGMQLSSLDRHSAAFLSSGSSSHCGQPAYISTETKSVPNVASDSTVQLDEPAVHAPCSAGEDRLSCDNSLFSYDPPTDKISRKSSNRLLRLIRRSSAKAHKQPVLPAKCSAVAAHCNMNSTNTPAVSSTDSSAVTVSSGNDQLPNVHRLPSPDVPPPPVPDDSATSRLFRLCHTSFSEYLPINITLESDPLPQYEDLSSVKSCTAATQNATLSSSYSAGDKPHCDSQSLKSSMNEENVGLSTRIPSYRHRHGWFLSLTLFSTKIIDKHISLSLMYIYLFMGL